ncbi:MAG: hypothetical protein J6X31_01325, partial [Bacteroidales bacterium]|nr:hypothetical protein [Bacteroidales bacterium]
ILGTICCLILSCTHERIDQEQNEKALREIEITIPLDSFELLLPATKKSNYSNPGKDAPYRYIVYYDSTACSMCTLRKMGIWNSIMKHSEETGIKVDFIFIMHPQKNMINTFKQEFYNQRFNISFYLDSTGITERLNPLLKESKIIRAFVLNKNNHIEVIGDAGKNYKVEKRFYDFLKRKKQSNDSTR